MLIALMFSDARNKNSVRKYSLFKSLMAGKINFRPAQCEWATTSFVWSISEFRRQKLWRQQAYNVHWWLRRP
jgi:hypothetical protein